MFFTLWNTCLTIVWPAFRLTWASMNAEWSVFVLFLQMWDNSELSCTCFAFCPKIHDTLPTIRACTWQLKICCWQYVRLTPSIDETFHCNSKAKVPNCNPKLQLSVARLYRRQWFYFFPGVIAFTAESAFSLTPSKSSLLCPFFNPRFLIPEQKAYFNSDHEDLKAWKDSDCGGMASWGMGQKCLEWKMHGGKWMVCQPTAVRASEKKMLACHVKRWLWCFCAWSAPLDWVKKGNLCLCLCTVAAQENSCKSCLYQHHSQAQHILPFCLSSLRDLRTN